MKTMNIHPFDNNHTSTTFSAVTKIIWTFIVIYFFTTADDNTLNHHHDYLPRTRTTSTFKDLCSSKTSEMSTLNITYDKMVNHFSATVASGTFFFIFLKSCLLASKLYDSLQC